MSKDSAGKIGLLLEMPFEKRTDKRRNFQQGILPLTGYQIP